MSAIIGMLIMLLNLYSFILLVRVILSWVAVGGGGINRDNPIIQLIYQLTDPPVNMVREYIPPSGGIDFSVLVLFLIIYILRILLTGFM